MYLGYTLGALIFIIDEMKKYENIANANPDPKIIYKQQSFWRKERLNIIQMVLLGVASVIILPLLFGTGDLAYRKDDGTVLWSVPMKLALLPLQIISGWTGGRAIIAIFGKSKKELYNKVGITEDKP